MQPRQARHPHRGSRLEAVRTFTKTLHRSYSTAMHTFRSTCLCLLMLIAASACQEDATDEAPAIDASTLRRLGLAAVSAGLSIALFQAQPGADVSSPAALTVARQRLLSGLAAAARALQLGDREQEEATARLHLSLGAMPGSSPRAGAKRAASVQSVTQVVK